MTDEQLENYRKYAPHEYEKRLGIAKLNHDSAQSYARWLLASLLAMNGAALVGIATSGDYAAPLFAASGLCFIAGIASGFVSGLFAWLNWDYAAGMYRDMANPNMLHGPEFSPTPLNSALARLDSTRRACTITGVLSACFLLLGLLSIWDEIALGGAIVGIITFSNVSSPIVSGEAKMAYRELIEVCAAWSAIFTFLGALFAYGKFLWERKSKRKRLERYLKDVQGTSDDQGLRSLVHLVANVGLSESEIMDAAFKSKHIDRKVKTGQGNLAVEIMLVYRP